LLGRRHKTPHNPHLEQEKPQLSAKHVGQHHVSRTPPQHAHDRPGSHQNHSHWTPADFLVPQKDGALRFHDLNLPNTILHAVADLEFSYCTPIQEKILPALLAGKDAGGRAQTGTGKTAAFLLAIFARLLKNPVHRGAPKRSCMPRALVIAPTRELAMQIFKDAQALGKYCGLQSLVVFGGMDYKKQQGKLRNSPPDLIVATPGRLLDFQSNGYLNLRGVEIMVIDEADRMLDMGFIPDVKRIIYSLPPKERRQTMLFSATLSDDILRLASRWMKDPLLIETEPERVTVDAIEQRIYVMGAKNKFALLFNLLRREAVERALVFRNRRDSVDLLAKKLTAAGVPCAQLSGEVPQEKRIRILEDFRSGKIRLVVATDVAGRGIHVEGISHVFNYDVPEEAEDYVHRIGRTGRAGASGIAITFACEEGSFSLPAIEKYIGRSLPCSQPDDELLSIPEDIASKVAAAIAAAHHRRHSSQGHFRPRPGRGRRPPPHRRRR